MIPSTPAPLRARVAHTHTQTQAHVHAHRHGPCRVGACSRYCSWPQAALSLTSMQGDTPPTSPSPTEPAGKGPGPHETHATHSHQLCAAPTGSQDPGWDREVEWSPAPHAQGRALQLLSSWLLLVQTVIKALSVGRVCQRGHQEPAADPGLQSLPPGRLASLCGFPVASLRGRPRVFGF